MRRGLLLSLGAALALSAHAAPAAFRDETLMLRLDEGREIPATLRLPANAKGRLPALMLFGGFRGAARVLDRVHTDRPVIWASFDYPFEPPRKFHFPQSLKHAPEMREAIHASIEGVVKLHEALRRRGDVDPARITVVGASAGAPFAVIGGARGDIPGVILVQGFADATAVIQNLLVRKFRPRYGDWVKWPALLLAKWIVWYCEVPDIAAHARELGEHQKVLMFTASEDDFIPDEATEALARALQDSQARHERVDLPGLHLGVGDDTQRIADLLKRSMVWMEREGLL